MKFVNVVDHSLFIMTSYLISLIQVQEFLKDFFLNNAYPTYYKYDQAFAKEPLPEGHKIYNFPRPFLGDYN